MCQLCETRYRADVNNLIRTEIQRLQIHGVFQAGEVGYPLGISIKH